LCGDGIDKTVGAIFPILPEHVSRLFEEKRDVFVKFTKFTNFRSGSVIVFYVSREKFLIGEGEIKYFERLDPEIAWSVYGDRIFLDKKDYGRYARISPVEKVNRKKKEITIFILRNICKYEKPVKLDYAITPSGRYLTKKMFEDIRRAGGTRRF